MPSTLVAPPLFVLLVACLAFGGCAREPLDVPKPTAVPAPARLAGPASSAYRVESNDEFHAVGHACDLEHFFFVSGNGVTVRFEPQSAEGGRYSYSGELSGLPVHGHGSYSVLRHQGVPKKLVAQGTRSVETPYGEQSRESSTEYALASVTGACQPNPR
jgi:hypothetical protein